jgi:arylamine N-acetyltransferase
MTEVIERRALEGYLTRLGVGDLPPATHEALADLHRRHVERVPYDNLEIMLGRPPSVVPTDSLERIATAGRAGYCFHHNGALQLALQALGFAVERRHGHVWLSEGHRDDTALNHLALVVTDLPTPDNPGGRWWPDVGLGEGAAVPLPLVAGRYGEAELAVTITRVHDAGWSYRNHALGSFRGLEVRPLPVGSAEVAEAHRALSAPPDGHFARLLVVQRRDGEDVVTLRGCVLSRFGPGGRGESDLTSYDEWRGALADELCLPVADVDHRELRGLWERMRAAHEQWVAEGRP